MAELRRRRDEVTGADLVELRVDTVDDPTRRARWRAAGCRSSSRAGRVGRRALQGFGRGAAAPAGRGAAAGRRVRRRRVESRVRRAHSRRGGRGVVVSLHDFDGVPADLPARGEGDASHRGRGDQARGDGSSADRFARSAVASRDARRADGAPRDGRGRSAIARARGALRIGWTTPATASRPARYRLPGSARSSRSGASRRRTAIYGVVGRPVMHSLSPAMHNAAFRAASIDAVYCRCRPPTSTISAASPKRCRSRARA